MDEFYDDALCRDRSLQVALKGSGIVYRVYWKGRTMFTSVHETDALRYAKAYYDGLISQLHRDIENGEEDG